MILSWSVFAGGMSVTWQTFNCPLTALPSHTTPALLFPRTNRTSGSHFRTGHNDSSVNIRWRITNPRFEKNVLTSRGFDWTILVNISYSFDDGIVKGGLFNITTVERRNKNRGFFFSCDDRKSLLFTYDTMNSNWLPIVSVHKLLTD